MKSLFAAALIALAAPALAGTQAVIDDHILPGQAAFARETAALAEQARMDCSAPALDDAYQSAFDAWMRVSHLRLGPVEEEGRGQAIAFWPDARGLTEKTLRRLIAEEDPAVTDPAAFRAVSIAARGFFALDRMLFDEPFSGYAAGSYPCAMVQAITADLAAMAAEVDAGWREGFADTLRNAGKPGSTIYLSEREATQALFTALTSALEFDADQRLGQPMGTFEKPRPNRAEAWRSDRPRRNVAISLAALRDMAEKLTDPPPDATLAAFDKALETVQKLDDPRFAGVATPQGRLKVEVIQQQIRAIRQAAIEEIGPRLGVAAGFNSADGD